MLQNDTKKEIAIINKITFYTVSNVTAIMSIKNHGTTGPLAWFNSDKLIPTYHTLLLLQYKLELLLHIA